jgi:type I restriction enzyme S subunit
MSTATTHIETEKRSAERSRSKLVPVSRFKEFNDEWETVTLFDLSENVSYGMNASAITFDGVHKYLRITDIDEETGTFKPRPLTSPEGEISEKFKLKKNDIVFTRTGASVGKPYLYNEKDGDLYYAGFLIKFSLTRGDSYFIYSLTQKEAYNRWVHVYSVRSGQPGLNAEEYKALKLTIPTLPEQQKIASFISAVDEKIQQLTKKKALLEQFKKGVMKQLFSGQLRFKDENGNPYPDWEKKRIDEILLPYSEPVNVEDKTMYQQIGIRSHGKGIFHKEFVSGKSLGNKRVFWIKENLFVVNIVFAWEHAVSVTTKGEVGMIASHRFPMYQPKNNLAHIPFITKYFLTPKGKYLLQLASPGGAGRNKTLGKQNFNELELSIPPLEEQQKIATYLTSIDTKIESVTHQITQTQTFKKGLLQQLFV